MNPQYVVLGAIETASRIIEFSPRTLFEWTVQVVNLLAIIGILTWLLFKPVGAFLSARTEKIKNQIDDAKNQKLKVETLRQDYETRIAKIQAEADEILRQARTKAKQSEEQIISAARAEAEEIKKRSLAEIQLEKERVKDEMKKEMIEVATLMAGKFIASTMDSNKQDELISEIINEAGDVQWLS